MGPTKLQSCAYRTQGIVLVRAGNAEDSHHRVADELLTVLPWLSSTLAVSEKKVFWTKSERFDVEHLAERHRLNPIAKEDRHNLARLQRARERAPALRTHLDGRERPSRTPDRWSSDESRVVLDDLNSIVAVVTLRRDGIRHTEGMPMSLLDFLLKLSNDGELAEKWRDQSQREELAREL